MDDLENVFTIGEIIETLIYSRESSNLGHYLGSTARVFGAVRIQSVVYHVERNIEVDSSWFWRVTNINTSASVELKDIYDLPCLVTV